MSPASPESEDINMLNERTCKECRRRKLPKGTTLITMAARALGYCRRCYREFYPKRPMWNLPACRQGSRRLLSYRQRIRLERDIFKKAGRTIWSPDFYKEFCDYWKAKERGEL